MHVILVSVGTDGDIFPYVGMGTLLRERGHQVTLVASEHYEELATAHGLAFRALVSAKENQELFGHPDFWNPLKTAPLMARWGLRFLERQYELLSKLVSRDAILVSNPGILAAAVVREKAGTPLAHIILQPWMIPSLIAPPVLPYCTFLRAAPRPVWRMLWRGLDLLTDLLVKRGLNRLRGKLGLKPTRRILANWLSPELVLGLFPPWYGPPQADWPQQIQLTGFPMFDGGKETELPADVLKFCQAGTSPIAFTFGTGMTRPRDMFAAALQACAVLDRRAIFLTRYADQLPQPLPPTVLHCTFAPFQKLFPHCAAVIHHGGIGSVAGALAAGIPQLIRPICFDQFDNAVRITAMGVGDWLTPRQWQPKQIVEALSRVMTPATQARSRDIAARFSKSDGLETAVHILEKFATTNPSGGRAKRPC